MKLPIYLDYSATTPADLRVAQKMCECLTMDGNFGNPASRSHLFGWKAEEAVEIRRQVAELVNADPREIVWTSGATESNNLAIKGAAHFYASKGKHLITIEDRAQSRAGHLPPAGARRLRGHLPGARARRHHHPGDGRGGAARRHHPGLASCTSNNEIGMINDIAAIGELSRARGILYHVDAAQTTGKLPIDLEAAQG